MPNKVALLTRIWHFDLKNHINMKPIWIWIEELEEPIKSHARYAISKAPLNSRHKPVNSLKSALLQGFVWGATDMSVKYWENVYKSITAKTLTLF